MSNAPTIRELKILALGFELAQDKAKALEKTIQHLEREIGHAYMNGWEKGHDDGWDARDEKRK